VATLAVVTAMSVASTGAASAGKNDLSASPKRANFGTTTIGSVVAMDIVITNTGATATTFTSGAQVTGWFGIDANNNHCAVSGLAAGESCTIRVLFNPSQIEALGHQAGTLTFSDTNAPTTFSVSLVGRAIAA
jgi:centrosomal CEP192-like protein